MEEQGKGKGLFGLIERIEGDKVIWMIVLMLIMISVLCISSSTPLLALQHKSSRGAIIYDQVKVVAVGLAIIMFFYTFVKKIGVLRFFSKLGFFFSVGLLAMLAIRINLPIVKAEKINDAYRTLKIMGLQLHVFEFTKVFMVMYLAWAMQAYHENRLKLADRLVKLGAKFMEKRIWRLYFYVFIPMLTVCILTLTGGVSSTLFTTLIMVVTVSIAGVKFKHLMGFAAVSLLCFSSAIGLYFATDGKAFNRIGTAIERISKEHEESVDKLITLNPKSKEYKELRDKVKQPISAKVAISEGGIFGKGPGGSTQRYVVPIMFEDYMFSFIVEEYGIVGALIVLILYGSLLARCVILVRNSNSSFTKTAIAGLAMMISGQAVMHMMINVDVGPLTGQTLPMISYGKASFVAFSMAFGIILAISRMIKRRKDELEQIDNS